jgi:phosphopantetheine--protein transferase-like protein
VERWALKVDRNARVLAERQWNGGAHVALAFERVWAADALRLLHPLEAAFASRLGQQRRETWAAGRAALRIALALAGVSESGAILPNGRGAPRLAPGVCGSISHKQGFVAAAVRLDRTTIGVDVEALDPPRSRIARRVLTPRELEDVSNLPESERWEAIAVRFSLKEAVYKAMDPWLPQELGFQDVSLRPLPGGSVIVEGAPAAAVTALKVDATWSVIEGAVISLAECRDRAGDRHGVLQAT